MTKRFATSSTYAFALEAQKPATPAILDDTQRPLSVSELAELIGWKRSKIDRYRKKGFLPAHRLGNSNAFFYLGEVLDALKSAPDANAAN